MSAPQLVSTVEVVCDSLPDSALRGAVRHVVEADISSFVLDHRFYHALIGYFFIWIYDPWPARLGRGSRWDRSVCVVA